MSLTLIELRESGPATWDVFLGEGEGRLDVSDIVENLHLHIDGRTRKPQATLELTAYPKFHLRADVVVDELTAECLKLLGWTPPKDEFETNAIAVRERDRGPRPFVYPTDLEDRSVEEISDGSDEEAQGFPDLPGS